MTSSFIEILEVLSKIGGAVFLFVIGISAIFFFFSNLKQRYLSKRDQRLLIKEVEILDSAFNDLDSDLWRLEARVSNLESKIEMFKNVQQPQITLNQETEVKPKRKPGRPPWKNIPEEQKTP